ncbi:unnamed protein product, partial [Rotaria sordida]
MQLDKNADNGETLASTYCENQLDFDIDMNDMEDEQDNIVEETSIEDVICWPTLKEKIPSLSGNKKDLDSFEKFYLQFLLDLREGHSLPQNIVQTVTSGNFNQTINRNAFDTDLMYDYRHASQAKQHPILKN